MPFKAPVHRPPGSQTSEERRKEHDQQRGTASQRGYNYEWAKYARAFRKEHPFCVHCEREGRAGPAEVVDHIRPHKGDQQLFWDPDNHQSLCKQHHDRKTATEDSGFARKR